MRRADRLFQIVQYLRAGKLLTAGELARRLEVSVRTIYRDIADLQGSGVPIEGEAGLGYLMRDGYDLPPIMFTHDELSALIIGARMIEAQGGAKMARQAKLALSKIASVLPEQTKAQTKDIPIFAFGDFLCASDNSVRIDYFNDVILSHQRIKIEYESLEGKKSRRKIDPVGMTYWGKVWTLIAWCHLRDDFRIFRLDRIKTYAATGEAFEIRPERSLETFLNRESDGHFSSPPAGLV